MSRYVAFIPVRGGSKSIPLKNIKPLAGRPLLLWTLDAALACPEIDRVVVSTDSDAIREVVRTHLGPSVEIHDRSAENAGDTASTESVMLEYARLRDDFDNMVLVQATSPLLTSDDLTRGVELHRSGSCASVLSVVRQKRFIWEERDGAAAPVNYDYTARPRRQEFDGFLVENGAFYVTSRESLLRTGHRLEAPVGTVEMAEETYFELDEPADWAIVEGLLRDRVAASAPDLSGIRALFTDCDGVLTDGGMYYSEHGDELKKFQTRDGMGFAMLRERGILTGIITTESVALVARRAAKLKLDELHMGVHDKLGVVRELCEKHGITLEQVAYVGDDVLDVPVIGAVGFGCSVADGMPAAREAAAFVTRSRGGEGAVREVAELILAAQR